MFAVIFEVRPRKERWEAYLGLAKMLRPELEATDGFIDNERFASKKTEGRVLSLSIWRDEKSVVRWRTHGGHHGVQEKGRTEVFADYHLRVGEVIADTGLATGLQEQRFDQTEVGAAKLCTITEVMPAGGAAPGTRDDLPGWLGLGPGAVGLVDHETYESITNPGKSLVLASWRDREAASGWTPRASDAGGAIRHRMVRVIRDYGMFDRREAPQFYPAVTKPDQG